MKLQFWLSCMVVTIPTLLAGQPVLEQYIKQGLESNLTLHQKEMDYSQNMEALREAKGLFYPSVSLNARYTVSEGGRVIDFPVGDLVNPLYQGLYQVTGRPEYNINLNNEQIRFLRPYEHETKLRLVQPVFNTDLYYNSRIKKEMGISAQISVEQYKRELIAEIKKAYYNVAMAGELYTMMVDTRKLLEENVRVNASLFKNNKITEDLLLRSRTELYKFEQNIQEAAKNRKVAQAYFNFLLNRPLNDSVLIEAPASFVMPAGDSETLINMALENREELKNLEQYSKITQLSKTSHEASRLPDVAIVADYGFQGEKYEFNKNQDYFQASAVLSWDLFSGFQNQAKIKQSEIQHDKIDEQIAEARNNIELQVLNAYESLVTAQKGYEAANEQVKAAREAFRLVNRRYQEGQASMIEFMDARNAMTQADANFIISAYNCFSLNAELEKVIAVKHE